MIALLRNGLVLLTSIVAVLGSVIKGKSLSDKSHLEFDGPSSGHIITAGGLNDNFLANAYALDINSGKWTDLPPLPQGLCNFNLVSRDSSVYAVGGQNAPSWVNSTLVLSIQEKMWKPVSDLLYDYGWVMSASYNGSIYAVGGRLENNTLQVMGCNGAWRKLAPSIYSHNSQYDAITVLNDKIFVQGCHHQDEVYDPSTDTWTAINMTNQDRCEAGIVALNGYIYVIGGANTKNERYDPVTGEIIYFEACLFNSVIAAAVVTDGEKIYVIGGQIGDFSNKVQVYRPDLDLWLPGIPYPVAACWMGAVYVKEIPTD